MDLPEEALIEAAAFHGVLGALQNREPEHPEAKQRLERLLLGLRLAAEAGKVALEEVLEVLGDSRIAACPLKGTFLAERLYPDPRLRPTGDLDVLVSPGDLDGATVALESNGWRLERGPLERHSRRHGHHLNLSRTGLPALELHFRPLSAFGCDLRTDELFSRARKERTRGGAEVLVLDPSDEFVLLSVHALRHQLHRAGWLLDLLYLLDGERTPDFEAMTVRASRWRCRTAFAHTLMVLSGLGARIPSPLAASPSSARTRLAERLRAKILCTHRSKARTAMQIVFAGLLADGVSEALSPAAWSVEWALRLRVHRALHGTKVQHP